MESNAFAHILGCYPKLQKELELVGALSLSIARDVCVADAVTRTVIGQMLSRKAAQTIYERTEKERLNQKLGGAWMLTIDELRSLGVSGRKAKCIKEFGIKYDNDPACFEAWRSLSYQNVVTEVSKHWGLSTWTADMLSIFYFGLEDVFPKNDGTIKRAISIINEKYYADKDFDSHKATPYKTYLSMYLWNMIDKNII